MYQVQDFLGSIVTAQEGPFNILAKSTTFANTFNVEYVSLKGLLPFSLEMGEIDNECEQVSYAIAHSR